eukprot:TRINITY_DN33085_c0_g1_i1.p1 TRINITY_DN33085_c0_g1~~TRINITY_DN33085_c0_g1_i1.p1  ORF type:complete len:482 (+),score=67.69 TRINITY_DN33085_c0_g1_i1:89-1447(+)
MPFYEPRIAPLPSCFESVDCQEADGNLRRCQSFPGYITFSMAETYSVACTRKDTGEETFDAHGDDSSVACADPSPQVWPDTDDELDLELNVVSSRIEPASSSCQRSWLHPTRCWNEEAINDNGLSWEDIKEELAMEQVAADSRNELAKTLSQEPSESAALAGWLPLEGSTKNRSETWAWADVEDELSDVEQGSVETSTGAQPVVLSLEEALAAPLASQGITSNRAQLSLSSPWLPCMMNETSTMSLPAADSPYASTPASFLSTLSTSATSWKSTSLDLQSITPQSRGQVASFETNETPVGAGPKFFSEDARSCRDVGKRQVPVPVGRCDRAPKKLTKSRVPEVSGTSPASTAQPRVPQETKAFGAMALKKARAMLPASNLKPSMAPADAAPSSIQYASESPGSNLAVSKTSESYGGVRAGNRAHPTLLQGLTRSRSNAIGKEVKPGVVNAVC